MKMTTAHQLNQVTNQTDNPPEGTRRIVDGLERVFYDGYWIKTYRVPTDSLEAKKKLIEALTRRLFNHTEHGLNIPGTRLNEARSSYESETDPARKRVKGAMLAGALFNLTIDRGPAAYALVLSLSLTLALVGAVLGRRAFA